MADITVYAGETVAPRIDLDSDSGADYPLAGSLTFAVGVGSMPPLFTTAATITDAQAGIVSVPLAPPNTDLAPGTYAWQLSLDGGLVLASGAFVVLPRVGGTASVSLTVGTDTYVSVADAAALLSKRLGVDAWHTASADDRARALATATTSIDSLPLTGRKSLASQALAFPRIYDVPVTEYDDLGYTGGTTPSAVLLACALEAAARLADPSNVHAQQQAAGVSMLVMGSMTTAYRGQRQSLVSPDALAAMRPYMSTRGRIV